MNQSMVYLSRDIKVNFPSLMQITGLKKFTKWPPDDLSSAFFILKMICVLLPLNTSLVAILPPMLVSGFIRPLHYRNFRVSTLEEWSRQSPDAQACFWQVSIS